MRKYKILFIVLMLCSFFTSDFSSLEEPQSEIFDGMIVSVGEGGDYTNIQDGIDNVSNNGTVLIHPGDYHLTETVIINKSINIIGIDTISTNLYINSIERNLMFKISSDNVTISNLTFNGNDHEDNRISGIENRLMNNTQIVNCMFKDMVTPISMNSMGQLLKNIYVYNCTFENSSNCIVLDGVNNAHVDECTFNKMKNKGISIRDLENNPSYHGKTIIENCDFSLFGIYGINSEDILKDVQIQNCTFNQFGEWFHKGPAIWGGSLIENNIIINASTGISWMSDGAIIRNNYIENCKTGIRSHFRPNVIGNTIINCTTGLYSKGYMVGVTAISNNLIDCGFHLTSGSANFYDSFYLEGNTVDGEELLYIQNGSGFDLIGDGARQIYIVNSDNFTISDYSQDEEKNYPVINLISCRDGTISDSNFIGGNPSLQIKYSENIEVFNNSILGGMQSMYLYGCSYISIYNNWFESSNLSFSDNSENHWDNGKIGNYWRNLSLTDENEDGFADTVVNIPGGTSVDRFPLVPGISLSVEPFLEYGTTGEGFPFTITAENLNLEMIHNISFYYGNSTDGYHEIQLDPEASVQIAYVQIPSDSTDTIEIWVNVSDTIGGYKESPIILFEVLDNDRPTYSIEDLPDEIGNNETVEIVVSALDNIGVKSVKASFHSVDGNYTHDLILIDGKWMFNFTTDPYLTQTYQFRMIVEDHAGNNATSEYFTIITVDTVPPILVQDLTVEEADSGETIQFKVLIEDHSNISKALVEYRQVEHYGELTLDPDNFSVNYTIPIDDISPLYYRFIFEDENGNRLTTDERVIEIIDPISPAITVSDYSMVLGTGEKLDISFSIQDNIGVNFSYSIIRINGETINNLTTVDGFSFKIPIDIIGELVFEIISFDGSMNIASFVSEPITIIDVIKPEITVTAPSVGRVGEEIIISYDASDNIGIDSVSCEQGVVDEINNEISIIPDSAGEMAISILVVDESGNSLIYNMTIFIEEEAVIVDPDNTSFPLILIIPAVLLLIILLITFIIWKRRRMPSDIGEGEPEE